MKTSGTLCHLSLHHPKTAPPDMEVFSPAQNDENLLGPTVLPNDRNWQVFGATASPTEPYCFEHRPPKGHSGKQQRHVNASALRGKPRQTGWKVTIYSQGVLKVFQTNNPSLQR